MASEILVSSVSSAFQKRRRKARQGSCRARVHVRTEARKGRAKSDESERVNSAKGLLRTPWDDSRQSSKKKKMDHKIPSNQKLKKGKKKPKKFFSPFFLPRTTSLAPQALLRVASLRATPFCLRLSKPEARRVVSSFPRAALPPSSSTDVDPDATKKKKKKTMTSSLPLPPTASGKLGASHPSHARDWENPAVTERNR